MAKRGGKGDEGQVLEAGGGDVLLINPEGAADEEGPAGILIPAAVATRIGPDLVGDEAWQTALDLVEDRQATAFPVKTFASLSDGLTAITLLLDVPWRGSPKKTKKAPAAKAKAKSKSKKR